ncbi:MAG: adenylate/guanylate cyclase domain-containing protein [Solirubrobacterales bacterium]
MSAARRVPFAWLIPQADEPGRDLARRVRLLLIMALVAANLTGALIVLALGVWVIPYPNVEDETRARVMNLITAGAYLLAFIPIGTWWGLARLRKARDWLDEDRPATPEERRVVLRGPRRILVVHVVIWSLAAAVFAGLNVTISAEAALRVAGIVALGGLSVLAFIYLISERLLRPAAARALAGGIGERRLGPGIKTRALIAWALGSAVPVVGLMTVAISTLAEKDFSRTELAILVLVLGGLSLAVGVSISLFAARAVADPVKSLHKAVHEVEDGRFDVEVPVYDGSEIGHLQAGFNSMLAGLRERERIQDLFGRHVGEDVARVALEQEIELGGEVRDVSVLFTDIIGSTELAAKRPPEEVVELLNAFFAIVVEVVDRHDGSVNKFEGDAALAIFGAPVALADPAGRALAAARELAHRLPGEVDGLEAAIGVSAGEVVAGNIGEERRYEYTVIGDPVNEAARLTELAKEKPGRVLASEAILSRAGESEAAHWRLDGHATLRGRSEETGLAVLVESG